MTTAGAAPATMRAPPGRGAARAAVRWTAAGNLARTVLATAQLLVVARLVSVIEFGLVVLAGSIGVLMQQLADAGLSSALIRFRDVTEAEKSALYWLNAGVGCALALALVVAAPGIAALLGEARLAPLLRVAALAFVAQGFFLQLRVMAERDLRFGAVMQVEVAGTATGFVVAVVLAASGFGAVSVVWGQVVSVTMQLVLGWWLLARGWRPQARFRWGKVRRFLGYGADLTAVNAAIALTVQLDVLIAGALLPAAVFGLFAQPRDLAFKVMTAIVPVVTRVGLPLIAEHQHNAGAAGRVYLRVLRMSATVCFPVFAAMAVAARDVFPIVLGAKWTLAAALMPGIALWFAVRCVVNPLGSYLYAMGRTRRALAYQLAFAAAVAGAAWVGARHGAEALSLAMAAVYLLFAEVGWAAMLRPISGVGFAAFHRQIAAPAVATVLAALVAWVGRGALGPSLPAISLAWMMGAGVFVAASLVLNRAGVEELLALAGRRRGA